MGTTEGGQLSYACDQGPSRLEAGTWWSPPYLARRPEAHCGSRQENVGQKEESGKGGIVAVDVRKLVAV